LWEFDSLSNSKQGLKVIYEGNNGSAKCVRLSPGDSLVASGCATSRLHDSGFGIWNTFSGELINYFYLPKMRVLETVEFTPNGKFLLIGGTEFEDLSDGRISIYSVDDLKNSIEKPFKTLDLHHQEYFYFSKDGSKMVSSHQDGSLRVWKVIYH
jgi:WD40 repeat protein